MKRKYSDAFKKEVVEDYYISSLGVRAIALKHGLPSKNYIEKWELYLKKKDLISPDATKPIKSVGRSSEREMREDTRTEREKQYESEIAILKTRVEYLEGLESLKPFLKKNKTTRDKVQGITGAGV